MSVAGIGGNFQALLHIDEEGDGDIDKHEGEHWTAP